jgi:hypothetical protein
MSTLVEESLAFCGSHIEAALNEGFVCQKEMKNSGKGNVQPSGGAVWSWLEAAGPPAKGKQKPSRLVRALHKSALPLCLGWLVQRESDYIPQKRCMRPPCGLV